MSFDEIQELGASRQFSDDFEFMMQGFDEAGAQHLT